MNNSVTINNTWVSNLLAIIAGAVLVLAFAPFNIWLLALLSPCVFLLLLQGKSRRQSLVTGFCYGLGLFGFGVNWVFNSIHEHGQAPFAVAVFITFIFILILSLFPAFFGFLQACFSRSKNWVRLLILTPALWILLEWIRGWLFTGFPWLQLGYSQLDSPLSAIVPITGVLGGSWLTMLSSSLLLFIIILPGTKRIIPMVALVCLVLLMFLVEPIEWTEEFGEPLNVTLVQGNIPQEHKWDPDWLLPTIKRYQDLTEQHWDSDLIVWPEAALPGYFEDFWQPVLEPLLKKAKQTNTELILGMLHHEDGLTYNTVIKLETTPQIYKKRHLVPFGEYIPFRKLIDMFGNIVTLPAGDISVADEAVMLNVRGHGVATSICFEDAFGNEMADFLPQATLLLNISNDAWFGDSLAPPQHLQIAQMRSLELGRPMMRANNTAVTAFIDYRGNIISRAPSFEVTSISQNIQPRQGSTPFSQWKNMPVVIMSLLLVLFSLWSNRKIV